MSPLHRTIGIAVVLSVLACAVVSSRRYESGLILSAHSMLCLMMGLGIWRRMDGCARYLASGLYLLWGLADLGWSISYFFLDLNSRSSSAILLTETFYCGAFFSAGLLILNVFERPIHLTLLNRIFLLSLCVASPIALRLIVSPAVSQSGYQELNAFHLGEAVAIISSYLLLCLSIVGIISSRSICWSQFCGGMACLVFGDWAMRLNKLMGVKAEFGIPSFLVLFGLYFSGLALLLDPKDRGISRFSFSSLISVCKLWMLSILYGLLVIYCVVEMGSLESLRTLSIAVSFGVIVAIFGSEALIGRVREVSERLGQILQLGIDDQDSIGRQYPNAIPIELRATYDFVRTTALREIEMKSEALRIEERHKAQRQAAHDIRSPLTALMVVSRYLDELPEEKRILVRTAANRIQDIANNLLRESRSLSASELTAKPGVLVSSLVESLVSEKRLQYRCDFKLEITSKVDPTTSFLFAGIDATELKRALSNLVNNAIEAISEREGRVTVSCAAAIAGRMRIHVTDTGKGIPTDVLARLGEEGNTAGKEGGIGLGLFHAKRTVESCGGKFSIQLLEVGTQVTLELPVVPHPKWFAPKIDLNEITKVLILDDDVSIHQVWSDRFDGYPARKPAIVHMSTARELKAWIENNRVELPKALYLVDFELLGQQTDGINMVEELDIANDTILVTSRYEETELIRRCERLGLRVLPKGMAGIVPIS